MISTKGIRFGYDGANRFNFPDLQIRKGEDYLIIGESGVGKTTLLHLLAGILKPESGSITINNTLITSLSAVEIDKFRGNQIGLIFQKSHFIGSLNLLENLILVQYLAGRKRDKHFALKLLDRLGIKEKASTNPRNLSQGQQQRASIAMALVNQPGIVLADEPTSSLDDKNCKNVMELLQEQSKLSKTNLVVITHDNRIKSHFNQVMTL